ncbi:hypothetical protein ACQJBY_010347 [Aegilops geniculata]
MEHGEQEQHAMDLPPGFRFHPTDEELITHYLAKKVADARFAALAVSVADLNKCEPWDLPSLARMGEKEWYFFCLKDRKYPTGLRTNRATESGYWKATGKDKDIFRGKALVGMKKTLVFYTGRAPKGDKSGWVMHEYRLNARLHAASTSRGSLSGGRAASSRVATSFHHACILLLPAIDHATVVLTAGRPVHFVERVGAVQGVQEEPRRRRSVVGAGVVSSKERRRGDDGGDRVLRGRRHPAPPAPGHVRLRRLLRRPGGARDLLLQQRAGGGPVLQPDGDGRLRHGPGPPRPSLIILPVGKLHAVRWAAAPRRGPEPGAAPGEQRVPPWSRRRHGAVRQPAAAGRVQGRAGEAERVAGHRAHLRREPRDLFFLRPKIRPRARAVGLLTKQALHMHRVRGEGSIDY